MDFIEFTGQLVRTVWVFFCQFDSLLFDVLHGIFPLLHVPLMLQQSFPHSLAFVVGVFMQIISN